MSLGDDEQFTFKLSNDATAQTVTFFATVNKLVGSDVNGVQIRAYGRDMSVSMSLAAYEKRNMNVTLDALTRGKYEVSWGYKTGGSGSGMVGFENVVQDKFIVYVDCSSDSTCSRNGTFRSVRVTTNPTGATVKVDGVSYGLSPVTVSLEDGSHVFAASKNGYNDASVTQSISGSTTVTLSLTQIAATTTSSGGGGGGGGGFLPTVNTTTKTTPVPPSSPPLNPSSPNAQISDVGAGDAEIAAMNTNQPSEAKGSTFTPAAVVNAAANVVKNMAGKSLALLLLGLLLVTMVLNVGAIRMVKGADYL